MFFNYNLKYYNLGDLTSDFFFLKTGKWVSLCCTVGYRWVTFVIEGVKFKFNDIKSLYTKNNSERWDDGLLAYNITMYFLMVLSMIIFILLLSISTTVG